MQKTMNSKPELTKIILEENEFIVDIAVTGEEA